MPSLAVKGAILHYESFGDGPLLILIAGANGRGSIFYETAKLLSTQYRVICWDRRGYSRSILRGIQEFNSKLATDADDAAHLIRHLTPEGEAPAASVIGTSSGAIVAQTLLLRHPEIIKVTAAHEPPSFDVLPMQSRSQAAGLMDHIYDIYRASGPEAAMETFSDGLSEGDDATMMRECMDPAQGDEIRANSLFWFEFELRQYPSSKLDLEKMAKLGNRYLPLAGLESGDGLIVRPISIIANAMGKSVARLPGGHVGYMVHPQEWAAEMLKVLGAAN